MKITVIGTTNLIGKHFIDELKQDPEIEVSSWNYNNEMSELSKALESSQIVFNLHEYQDFSILPDRKKLQENNVDFVRLLLDNCFEAHVPVIVHLSSTYLQCSYWWPNINGRESEDYEKFRKQVPFQAYCESKFQAECLVRDSDIRSVIARVGPVYGEGDSRSLICDFIAASKYLNPLPTIGDKKGVFQFTYVGNVASALAHCGRSMFEDDGKIMRKTETVLVRDDTPLEGFFDFFEKLTMEKKIEKGSKLVSRTIPFFAPFPAYLCASFLIRTFGNFFHNSLGKLPSPNYLYLALHNWTYYSDFKLRVLFNHLPKYDRTESFHRARNYYKSLKPDEVEGQSWIN